MQVDLREVNFANPPTFEVITERVRVWSPSNQINRLYALHVYPQCYVCLRNNEDSALDPRIGSKIRTRGFES